MKHLLWIVTVSFDSKLVWYFVWRFELWLWGRPRPSLLESRKEVISYFVGLCFLVFLQTEFGLVRLSIFVSSCSLLPSFTRRKNCKTNSAVQVFSCSVIPSETQCTFWSRSLISWMRFSSTGQSFNVSVVWPAYAKYPMQWTLDLGCFQQFGIWTWSQGSQLFSCWVTSSWMWLKVVR